MSVQELEYKDQVLKIEQDIDAMNPRTEFDNMGVMVCDHGRYTLGDIQLDGDSFMDHLENEGLTLNDVALSLPLYLLDHSGITISTRDFNDQWDSGMVGRIYITKQKIRDEYSVKRISKKILKQAEECLLGEIETYDQYLRGDVYGFILYKKSNCDHDEEHLEHIDSCWGFYGDDIKTNGISDHVENFEKFEEI